LFYIHIDSVIEWFPGCISLDISYESRDKNF